MKVAYEKRTSELGKGTGRGVPARVCGLERYKRIVPKAGEVVSRAEI